MNTHVELIAQSSVNGSIVRSVSKKADIDASIALQNFSQSGSILSGDIVAKVIAGGLEVDADFPVSFDTEVGNEVDLHLGDIDIPFIGSISVDAVMTYNLPQRSVCAAVTLAGVVSIAKVCTNF